MLSDLFDRELPRRLHERLEEILGSSLSRDLDAETYCIVASGQFQGARTADLLEFSSANADGALLITEQEHHRVLYFSDGQIVGAASSALFEQLGRVLLSAGLIEKDDARRLTDLERGQDAAAVLHWLPEDMAAWVVHRRAWEVGAALHFIGHGHFVFIEGAPLLDELPVLEIEPRALAERGQALYDAWRREPAKSAGLDDSVSGSPALPAASVGPLAPRETPSEFFGDLIGLLRDKEVAPVPRFLRTDE